MWSLTERKVSWPVRRNCGDDGPDEAGERPEQVMERKQFGQGQGRVERRQLAFWCSVLGKVAWLLRLEEGSVKVSLQKLESTTSIQRA